MVFDKLQAMIHEKLKVPMEKITLDAKLIDDLGADSIDAVDLIMTVESEFDFEISDDDAQNLKTVGDLVKLIEDAEK